MNNSIKHVSRNITVPAFPVLNFSLLFGRKVPITNQFINVYGNTDSKFFYFGRSAIWNAIKLLGLKPEDNILMPSYHCSVEVEAVNQADVKIKFFEVKNDMNADLNDLRKKIDNNTKAIFIIHYFGFPQPINEIMELCEKENLFLIEDCAHAFLSIYNGRPLGTYGDFGILSMQKFLPLPSGGVLLTNNSVFNKAIELHFPNKKSLMRTLFILLLRNIEINHYYLYHGINNIILNPLRKIRGLFMNKSHTAIVNLYSVDFSQDMAYLGMNEISKKILGSINLDDVVNCRRANYNSLLERIRNLKSIKICFQDIPDGICPYFLPVELENRDEVYKKLLLKNISTFIFGEFLHDILPQGSFNTAKHLSKNILALPIHQDISQGQIEYIADNLKTICSDINKH